MRKIPQQRSCRKASEKHGCVNSIGYYSGMRSPLYLIQRCRNCVQKFLLRGDKGLEIAEFLFLPYIW